MTTRCGGSLSLRPYQRDCLKSVLRDYRTGCRRLLLVLGTGAGKTELLSRLPELLRQQPGEQGVFLVNRDDLVWQAERVFERNNPTLKIGVEKAETYAAPDADVIIASIQTLSTKGGVAARCARFDVGRVKWLVCDECFPAGTPVDGVPINQRKLGDVVKSYDHSEKRLVSRRVRRLFKSKPHSLVRVWFTDGRSLVCTPQHPIYDTRSGYIPATTLSRESSVLCSNSEIRVDRVEILEPGRDGTYGGLCPDGFVYNLEVEEHHNYFADGILVHNCHFAVSEQWLNVLKYFRVFKGADNDPDRLLLGCTATSLRSDGVGLEFVFDKITHEIPIQDLMKIGPEIDGQTYSYLAPIRGYRVQTEFDASMVRSRKGEFSETDLSRYLDTPERNRLILEKYLELGENMPAVAFTVNVAHSHSLAQVFEDAGVPAAPVSGHTSRAERDRLYAAYDQGEIKMLASCEALITGWDRPRASVALMTAPTRSGLKYQQAIGRVMRRFPSVEVMVAGDYQGWVKPYCLVLDFCDLMGTHSLCTMPSLFGLKPYFDCRGKDILGVQQEVQQILRQYPGLGHDFTSVEELRSQVDSVDMFRAPTLRPDVRKWSKFSWLEVFEGVLQLGAQKFTLEVRVNSLGAHELYQTRSGVRLLVDTLPTLAEALARGDELVPAEEHAVHRSRAAWRNDPPTEKQCRKLYGTDQRLKGLFPSSGAFFEHAAQQFRFGSKDYSKGGLSQMIDRIKLVSGSGQRSEKEQ